jgi:hypothetical protein
MQNSARSAADALEHTLAAHIFPPLLWTMVAVTVTLDRPPSAVGAFNHHVNAITQRTYLRSNATAELEQASHHGALEIRDAQSQCISARFDIGHRVFEVGSQSRFQVVWI